MPFLLHTFFHVLFYLIILLITFLKSVLNSNVMFCSSQVLCGSASCFTLFDNITARAIGLPIPVELLARPPGTSEDLLDLLHKS